MIPVNVVGVGLVGSAGIAGANRKEGMCMAWHAVRGFSCTR